ncbi:MAG: hypothetical protein U1F66_12205 [bacterium]
MKGFVKYLALGVLGLVLNLALPNLPLDWLAIVWTQAYLTSTRKSVAWLLLACLAYLYSAFSLSPPWQLALPLLGSALAYSVIQRNLSLDLAFRRFLLLAGTQAARLLLWAGLGAVQGHGFILSFNDGIWAVATLLAGLWAWPAVEQACARLLRRFASMGRSARGVDLSRADWLGERAGRLVRKPFGLEKGL